MVLTTKTKETAKTVATLTNHQNPTNPLQPHLEEDHPTDEEEANTIDKNKMDYWLKRFHSRSRQNKKVVHAPRLNDNVDIK